MGSMMKAYSEDLRERILWAVDQGHPRAEIVQRFGVSLSTVKRYLKLRRDEGHVRPTAAFTKINPCDKTKTYEHILKMYGTVLYMWVISGSHTQRSSDSESVRIPFPLSK